MKNSETEIKQGRTPDSHAIGLIEGDPYTLRYDDSCEEPEETADIMRRLIPRGARVLDVGCGAGALTIAATRGMEAHVIGVEPDSGRAERARQRGLNVVCKTVDPALLKELGAFDVIILGDVLEHLAEPAELLGQLRKALTPGGTIIASVPNVAHWTVRLRLLIGKFDYQIAGIMDATHLRWFTRYSLRKLLERSGYDIDLVTATAGAWMSEYKSFPFSLLPPKPRYVLVRRLVRAFPRLFGCQFVVKARATSAAST